MANKIKIDDKTYECQLMAIDGLQQWEWLICLLMKMNIAHAVLNAEN